MYEWLKKTFSNLNNVIFSGMLLILLLWGTITNIRLYTTKKHLRRTEQRLDDIRTELESAQNRESELTATVGNIRDITERADKILNESGNTIQSIREKIQVLENYFNSVSVYLCTSSDNNDNLTDSN